MSLAIRRIVALLLSVIVFFVAFPAFADAKDGLSGGFSDGDASLGYSVVYTEEELDAWLNSSAGGTVSLGASVSITSSKVIENPVVIDTGPYSLVYAGGYLWVLDSILITGEGVDNPVLEVRRMGRLFVGNWNNCVNGLDVIATGRGTTGGTAVRVHSAEGRTVAFDNLQTERVGKIRARGEGAVGLEMLEAADAAFFDIEVEGKDSTAVLAHQNLNICFSKLSAIGDGAQAVRAGAKVLADNCAMQPIPGGETVEIYEIEPYPVWLPIKQGSSYQEVVQHFYGFMRYSKIGLTGGSSAVQKYSLAINWDLTAIASIDYGKLGLHTVSGDWYNPWLEELLSGMPELFLDVRDPDVPCITSYGTLQDITGFLGIQLSFWLSDAWEMENCILWYSSDHGKTWSDCTNNPELDWSDRFSEGNVSVPASMIDEGVMFYIEVPGFGESNLAHFSSAFPNKIPDAGGDRIGTDRVGVNLGAQKPTGTGNPNPSDPEPGNPNPSDPEPGNPDPNDPEPGNPDPNDPEPGNPDPNDPEPGNPDPSDPEPGKAAQDSKDRGGKRSAGRDPFTRSTPDITMPAAENESVPLAGAPEVIAQTTAVPVIQPLPAIPPGPAQERPPDSLQEDIAIDKDIEIAIPDAPVPAANAPTFEPSAPVAQPAVPASAANTGAVVAVFASVVVLASGGWLWLRRRRVKKR